MSDFIKGLWPRSLFTWLGLILGAMSVLKLVEFGSDYQFSLPFHTTLNWYDTALQVLVDAELPWWSEPLVQLFVSMLSAIVGFEFPLFPHWKHTLVLMGIYFFRDAARAFKVGLRVSGIFLFFSGTLVALVSAVAVGSVPLTSVDGWANFLVAAIPVAGAALYDLGRNLWGTTFLRKSADAHRISPTWWEAFSRALYFDAWRFFIGIALIVAGLQIPVLQHSDSPGLILLAALVIILAIHWSLTGISSERLRWLIDQPYEPWIPTFWRTTDANLGRTMLLVFILAGASMLANAGLRFYGL